MKKPNFNWKITVPISSIALLAAIGFGLLFLGKMFAADILNELVRRESKGYYRLDFEELKLNPFKKRITVNNLVLTPDESKNFADLGLTNLYEIELGQLLIDFESIYGFYFDKELDISNVRIVDPYINMVKLKAKEGTKFSMEAGDLYQAISDYLEVLKIDYFHIQDGALDYSQNDFSLGNIDFVVQNLLMDSTNRENNVFYSESIELEIRNQKFNLPDGIHTITFESFLLSTKDSVLTFKNFELVPRPESGVTFEGNNDVNVYNIQVPELSLKGIDYVAAYQENKLRVQELYLKEPTVFVDDESHAEEKARENDNSVMALIFKVFSSLEVDKLTIDQAHIDLKLNGQKNYQRFKAEETNLMFNQIRIDTSNFRFHSRHQYFQDLTLDVHNYQYFLPDSVHVADFDLLRLNSITEEVQLQNLKISPVRASEIPTIDLLIPALVLHGVDYRKALLDKQLVADTVSLVATFLQLGTNGKKNGRPFEIRNLHSIIEPYFESVDVGRFLFRGRKLDPSESVHLGAMELNIQGVRVNSRTRGWADFMRKMDIHLSDFKLDQDSLKVNGATMSGNMEGFFLADWRVDLNTAKQKIKGKVDTLRISGVTLDSVLTGKSNYFTRVELHRPEVEFDITSGYKGQKFEDHVEKELLIVDGSLMGTYDDWKVSIGQLSTDVFEGDSTAFRSLESRDIALQNDALNHRLRMSRWNYDTLGGEMDFHDIRINPLKKDSTKSLVDANIPFIGLKEFEQAEFFNHNHFILSELKIEKPQINFFLVKNEDEEPKKSDSTFLVDIAHVVLDSANFQLTDLSSELQKIRLDNVSMKLDQFDYPSPMIAADKLLFSDEVKVDISRIGPEFSSDQQLDISGFSYSSIDNSLKLDSVNLSSAETYAGVLKRTEIMGLDLPALNDEGAIVADKIAVVKVSGTNKLGVSKKEPSEFRFSKTIYIDSIDLPEIQWEILDPTKEKTYLVKDGYLRISGIQSTGELKLEDVPARIRQLQFGGDRFGMELNQGYFLEVADYEVNHPDHTIALNELTLQNSYSKEEFSTVIDSQSDWFDVSVDEVLLKPSNLPQMIRGDLYGFEMITLAGLDATIYRDKAVPANDQSLRPLPSSILRDLKIPLLIDSLRLTGNLVYQEKAESGEEAGEMTFNDLDVNLINVKTNAQTDEMMRLNAEGMLMNAGAFEATAQFELTDPNDRFSLSGSLTDFPIDSLNRMLVPVANVRINKGFADELLFNFIANDTLAQGEMRFKYKDLRIRIFNAKTHEKGGLGTGIKSFFANTFVVKRKNPSFLFLRKGTIFHHRDSSKAIFNYWAKALLSGSVSSIGIHKSDKEEKKFERALDAKKEDPPSMD